MSKKDEPTYPINLTADQIKVLLALVETTEVDRYKEIKADLDDESHLDGISAKRARDLAVNKDGAIHAQLVRANNAVEQGMEYLHQFYEVGDGHFFECGCTIKIGKLAPRRGRGTKTNTIGERVTVKVTDHGRRGELVTDSFTVSITAGKLIINHNGKAGCRMFIEPRAGNEVAVMDVPYKVRRSLTER